MSNQLIAVNSKKDILPPYKNTPIADLLAYHNLNQTFKRYGKAEILIGLCMDNRMSLCIPDKFAFIIRSAGVNLMYSEFQISFAISMGNLKHVALISHNHCGMSDLKSVKNQFISGLVNNAGWKKESAINHFESLHSFFEIGNEIDFIEKEACRLKKRYPKITVAPLHYDLDNGKIYQIKPAQNLQQ